MLGRDGMPNSRGLPRLVQADWGSHLSVMRALVPPACLVALACGGQPRAPTTDAGSPDTVAMPAAGDAPISVMGSLVGANVQWGNWHSSGNADALAGLYTEDAVLMTPTGDVVGREAIRAHFTARFGTRTDSIFHTTTDQEALDVAGDRAYEAGTITFMVGPRGAGPGRPVVVRYVTFWQRQSDGAWRIRRSLR